MKGMVSFTGEKNDNYNEITFLIQRGIDTALDIEVTLTSQIRLILTKCTSVGVIILRRTLF
jgi:hypothetical protein